MKLMIFPTVGVEEAVGFGKWNKKLLALLTFPVFMYLTVNRTRFKQDVSKERV
jgi:hypothetical protein